MTRPTLWRRLRRATRGPRNAVLARAIFATARALGVLPVSVALAAGAAFGQAAHALLGGPRRLALAHLAIAFPDLDPGARRRIAREMFGHAGRSFAELGLQRRLVARPGYLAWEGREALDAALAGGRGALVVTGHVGNWELLASACAAVGYPITVVGRRVNDVRFHALIVRFRRGAGLEVLARDAPDLLGRVRRALAANRIVAMLIDQDTRGAGVFVPFFGRLAHTPPGAAILALRTRAPLLSVFIERRPEGGHRIRFTPVAVGGSRTHGAVIALTARLTAAIEAQIRRAPAEWVWWHRRWRRRPPPGSPEAAFDAAAAPS